MKLAWATPVAWILVFLLTVALVLLFQNPTPRAKLLPRSYSQLLAMGPNLKAAVIYGDELEGRDETGARFAVQLPRDAALADRLAKNGTDVVIGPSHVEADWLTTLLTNGAPLVFYALVWIYPLMRIARALEGMLARGNASAAGTMDAPPPSA